MCCLLTVFKKPNMKQYVLSVFCLFLATTAAPPPKQYRSDYEYDQQINSFYKFHTYATAQTNAKRICATEGAHLVHPGSPDNLVKVHAMMKRFPDVGPHVWVADDPITLGGDDSTEEKAIINLSPSEFEPEQLVHMMECDVMTRGGAVETLPCYRSLPFVCQVSAKDLQYDSQCQVYSANYNYSASLGSCYKVSRYAFTWNEAYSECNAEGAHLIVLNSDAERLYVVDLLKISPRAEMAKESYFHFAGIRANRPTDGSERVFRTVLNTTLDEAGYAVWSDGEPNNHRDNEYCGSIFANNGKYNDVDCTALYGYICETEVRH